jgi:ribonuclease HI
MKGCRNPHKCAQEALTRLQNINPKLNPLIINRQHGNFSLTKRCRTRNEYARENNGDITFDPSITCKEDLAECFRVFTNPDRIMNIAATRFNDHRTNLIRQEVTIYTDGACLNNGKANARCGSGIWIGPEHDLNQALRVPGDAQSNQIGELAAVIAAISAVPKSYPIKIITDSRYVITGLTTHLGMWEDKGWIEVKNAEFFKAAAYLLRQRTATATFRWVKGHNGDLGNEESDRLAKEGAEKDEPDPLNLEIPPEFDLQGAKLATLTQAVAYRGIRARKPPRIRQTTEGNLRSA